VGRLVTTAVTIAAAVLVPGVAAAAPAGAGNAGAGNAPAGAASAPSTNPPTSTQPSLDGKTTLPAGSLVGTGGFEPPDVDEVSGFDTYTAADHPKLGAWTITAGSIDLIGAGWETAAEGKQYIDLNGNDGGGTAATLTQTLDTTNGRRYRLEFLLAGNPHGDPPVKHLQVRLGTVTKSLTTHAADGGDTLNWRTVEMAADACSSDGTVLTFTSRTEGERGPLIDAVSVMDIGPASACGAGTALWQVLLLSGLGAVWVAAMVALGWAVLRRTDRGRPGRLPAF
jgi:choice-of-anchor C domain-containing protein